MRGVLGIAALSVVACGERTQAPPPASPPAPPAAAPADAAPAAVKSAGTPCPEGAALEALVHKALGFKGGKLEGLSCAPGRFGKPAWVVWGRAYDIPVGEGDQLEDNHALLAAVIATDGAIIADATEFGMRWVDLDYGPTADYLPADLDGDGFDELVTVLSSSKGGYFERGVTVSRVVGNQIHTADEDELFVSYDDGGAVDEPPGPTDCPGEIAIEGRTVVITHGAPTGDPAVIADRCPAPGVTRAVLEGDVLVVAR